MYLCLSIYLQILKDACLNKVSNKQLLQTLVNTIDPNADYSNQDTQVSRLFKGQANFPAVSTLNSSGSRKNDQYITDIVVRAKTISINDIAYRDCFERNVKSLIDPDKLNTAFIKMITLVKKDKSITLQHYDLFLSCTGLPPFEIHRFSYSNLYMLFASLFLYIILINENKPTNPEDLAKLCNIDTIGGPTAQFLNIVTAQSSKTDVEKYLDRISEEYDEIRTLLYVDTPVPFYDFYVQNNLSRYIKTSNNNYRRVTYEGFSISDLRNLSSYIIIKGTGGLGKSMMMRNLLLSATKEYKRTKLIPVLVQLKNYDGKTIDAVDFIFYEVKEYWPNLTIQMFEEYLEQGKLLILLDGLDELNNIISDEFQNSVAKMVIKYPRNQYVISSRPFSTFSVFSRFVILELCPFTKKQGLQLIDKLHFRDDTPQIKMKFRDEFDNNLYLTHKGFSDNPLLLTIMLMTYEEFAEVPSKMHLFYQEAYTVLSKKHDASKGGYKRALKTGISVDYFAEIFSRFCALTYTDQKYEFTLLKLEIYFRQLKSKYNLEDVTTDDFLFDCCNNLCLMYLDGDRYSFIHRSFQEYFCARYFAMQKDKNLDKIGQMLEKNKLSRQNDNVLKMLYDMIPEKVKEYMLFPYMGRLVNKCEEQEGFKTFLKELYGCVEIGDGDMEYSVTISSNSPLYQLITYIYGNGHTYISSDEVEDLDILPFTAFCVLEGNDTECIEIDEVPDSYIREYGEPEICGRIFTLDFSEVFEDHYYDGLTKSLNSINFSLYEEYFDFLKEYDELSIEYSRNQGNDLFDILD